MILYKYIFKDILKVQSVCFVVLFAVFLCQSVIKILGQASAGIIPVDIVSEMVLYSMPSVGFILIPLTLYIGIIVSLSRMSSDSEMAVMKAIGISGFTFMRISLVIAAITAVLTGINCLYLMPEATLRQKELSNSTQNNPVYLPIESGKFTDFGDYTIYVHSVEGANKQKVLKQIFIIKNVSRVMINQKDTIFLTSNSGYMHTDEKGVLWFTMNNGALYQTAGVTGKLEKIDFDSLSVPIPSDREKSLNEISLQSISTMDLIKSDKLAHKVELQWRIAPIIACFIFAMIAIPLSMINPRQGKFARLGPAIALFVCYYLVLLSVRNILNSDKLYLYPGMYIVPIIFLLFVAIPLNSDRSKFKRRKS
ncbi:MAG: LPS export ABC transporter permease LptF [Succinivibrio sp.]